jgi:DNA-directed RNA polymerase specialized sigma24 family protein
MSFEEIGSVLDRNEVAVRKRYSRAIDVLRRSIGRALSEEGR